MRASRRVLSRGRQLLLRDLQPEPQRTHGRPRAPIERDGTLHRAGPSATSLTIAPFESPARSRSLKCCLIGPTNAGKSTLLNALIDTRVSTVSDKIHTTRANTIGYLTDTESATQLEFVDAPGALGPDVPSLHRACWDAVRAVDVALVVVDAADARSHRQVDRFLRRLERELEYVVESGGVATETALVLNKVDLLRKKERLLRVSAALHEHFSFDWPPFMISAASGSGVHHLRDWLLNRSVPRDWSAPAGVTHMQPPLERATELIREQIFRFTSRELPYLIEQRNIGWTELRSGGLRIDQQLLLPTARRSARQVVLRRLAGIAAEAQRALTRDFERPVRVYLSLGNSSTDEAADALASAGLDAGLAFVRDG